MTDKHQTDQPDQHTEADDYPLMYYVLEGDRLRELMNLLNRLTQPEREQGKVLVWLDPEYVFADEDQDLKCSCCGKSRPGEFMVLSPKQEGSDDSRLVN